MWRRRCCEEFLNSMNRILKNLKDSRREIQIFRIWAHTMRASRRESFQSFKILPILVHAPSLQSAMNGLLPTA